MVRRQPLGRITTVRRCERRTVKPSPTAEATTMSDLTCRIPDCGRPVKVKREQLCNRHYLKLTRHGDPLWQRPVLTDDQYEAILWERIAITPWLFEGTPCWLWAWGTTAAGYGRLSIRGVEWYTHRWAYERWVGPIRDGREIDHRCRRRACCNPAHLEAVTHDENVRRADSPPMINARKTHCVHGHEFTPENTYTAPSRPGSRECRKCTERRGRVQHAKKMQAKRDG